MKYIQLKPSLSADIHLPLPNVLNVFLDANDLKFKTIDSDSIIKLLMDSNSRPTLQQVTEAGSTTINNITVANINISSILLCNDNDVAKITIPINNLYRLPMQTTNSYYPVGIVK